MGKERVSKRCLIGSGIVGRLTHTASDGGWGMGGGGPFYCHAYTVEVREDKRKR